jgi:hypothetical protein
MQFCHLIKDILRVVNILVSLPLRGSKVCQNTIWLSKELEKRRFEFRIRKLRKSYYEPPKS